VGVDAAELVSSAGYPHRTEAIDMMSEFDKLAGVMDKARRWDELMSVLQARGFYITFAVTGKWTVVQRDGADTLQSSEHVTYGEAVQALVAMMLTPIPSPSPIEGEGNTGEGRSMLFERVRCYTSRSGNRTWQLTSDSHEDTLYIRQANRALFIDAGGAWLDEMALDEVRDCKVACVVVRDGDFWKPVAVDVCDDDTPIPSPLPKDGEGGDSSPLTVAEGTPLHQVPAILDAYGWLHDGGEDVVYLDLETTGLGYDARIVQVGIIDGDGETLVGTLVNPEVPIGAGATAVHGIDDAKVKDAPTFAEVAHRVANAIDGKRVIVYNAAFDVPIVVRELERVKVAVPDFDEECAMLLYAQYWGDWDDRHESYAWQKLVYAMRQQKLDAYTPAHDAVADAQNTRTLVEHIAGQAILGKDDIPF
jgi:DNA polymerase-3 subunit epsilon